jgi:phosphatidylglycerol:prolipoprotein diacylglycerol transferase
MLQVFFRIPTRPFNWLPAWWPDYHIAIYGYGVMLALTLFVCTWMTCRRARREGISPLYIQDLAVWIFLGGIIGARVVYMIQYREPWSRFIMIWQGGLVFYGSAIGGVVGYFLAYLYRVRKDGISTWQLADIIAPACAIGLCLGRIGCFLNGCCYGNVACAACPSVSFPMASPARYSLVAHGYQTAAGFTLTDESSAAVIGAIEPNSPVAQAGLRPHDLIVRADGHTISSASQLRQYLVDDWPRGKNDLALTIRRDAKEIELPAIYPKTIGLHPTQLYESISMFLLFLLLTAYYPFRRRIGQVMVLFILCYAVHRFLNEILRNDTDPVAFGMTLSENGSIFFFVVALILSAWLWLRGQRSALVNGLAKIG